MSMFFPVFSLLIQQPAFDVTKQLCGISFGCGRLLGRGAVFAADAAFGGGCGLGGGGAGMRFGCGCFSWNRTWNEMTINDRESELNHRHVCEVLLPSLSVFQLSTSHGTQQLSQVSLHGKICRMPIVPYPTSTSSSSSSTSGFPAKEQPHGS